MLVPPRARQTTAVAALLLASALCGCSSSLAQPAAPPTSSPVPAEPRGSILRPVDQQLDDLAEQVVEGRHEWEVPGLAGLEVDGDHAALHLWWVGEPPERIRRLVADPPGGLTVTVQPATYDAAAMSAAVDRVLSRYRTIHAGGPEPDGSGIEVETTAEAARTGPGAPVLTQLAGMPVRVVISEPPRPA